MTAPLPGDEEARLGSLRQYDVLDTPQEEGFEDLTLLAAHICGVHISMVSFVDRDRQWFKSRRGLEMNETPRDISFCGQAILQPTEMMVVPDALADPRFKDSPLVTGEPHVRFYAGAPLVTPDGHALGTLCVMDSVPRTLDAGQLAALRALSRRAMAQLELRVQSRNVAREAMERQKALALVNRQYDQLAASNDDVTRMLVSAERSRRALLSVLEDEKLAGEKLQASEARFRELIENSTDVIIVLDGTGVITYQSPSVVRLLGYQPEEMQGRRVLEFVHPDDREKATQSIENALSTDDAPKLVEYRVRHKDGAWRIVQSMGKRMRESTGQLKIVVNSRDVTEARLMEEKFLRAQRMEAVGTLASGVAHDLNNILTPMLMVAGLLKETLLDPRDREMLTMIERSAQRGAGIISQLLTFSRGIEGERVSVQPVYLLKEMMNLMQETFPRSIEIRLDVQNDLWPVVVDATQLHQVLMNLCVNARDAMPDGGTLTLTAKNVHLTEKEVQASAGASAGCHVLLAVADTGHGIPAPIIERIFDPFFTTKQIGKGTGLGLSTVIGIVRSHKGVVNVYSEPGRGTVFRVYLPSTETTADPELRDSNPPIQVGHGELILLVDDEAPILEASRLALETKHYRVLGASNGEEAIRIFVENSAAVKLVVTDMMMPVMGGIAVINALRVLKPELKFIATTGLNEKVRADELAHLGVLTVLAKPFTPSALLHALDKALKGTEEDLREERFGAP